MRVAQVIGKLAAAGVEAVVNNYYCSMNTERIQFDYFIDEDSELAPPQEMIDRGARYFVVPSTRHAAARVRALTALFRENHYAIVHAHMNTLNLPVLYAAWRADVPVRISHNHSAAAPEEKARTLLKLMLRPTAGWFATDRDGVRRAGGGLDVWKKSGRGGARHGAAQRHRRRRVRL